MRISDWSSDVCSSDLAINASGYGLTLGVHTRIDGVAAHIAARAAVGNVYVNRNQIGAIVGSQPFGGRGLSGAGPKAGEPTYLHRLAEGKSISPDITPGGGHDAQSTGWRSIRPGSAEPGKP